MWFMRGSNFGLDWENCDVFKRWWEVWEIFSSVTVMKRWLHMETNALSIKPKCFNKMGLDWVYRCWNLCWKLLLKYDWNVLLLKIFQKNWSNPEFRILSSHESCLANTLPFQLPKIRASPLQKVIRIQVLT